MADRTDLLWRLDDWGETQFLVDVQPPNLPEYIDAVLVGRLDEQIPRRFSGATQPGGIGRLYQNLGRDSRALKLAGNQ